MGTEDDEDGSRWAKAKQDASKERKKRKEGEQFQEVVLQRKFSLNQIESDHK